MKVFVLLIFSIRNYLSYEDPTPAFVTTWIRVFKNIDMARRIGVIKETEQGRGVKLLNFMYRFEFRRCECQEA